MPYQSENITRSLVRSLWTNWAVAFGTIALALFLGRIIPKLWLPFPIFILAYFELVYLRRRQAAHMAGCTAMISVSVLTLFWSSLIMLAINFINSKLMFDNIIDWSNSNSDIPYINCLILFPVMIIMSLWVMAGGYGLGKSDTVNNGILSSNSVLASLFKRESHYQVQLMLFISCGLTAVEWWYYFTYYINVNWNTPGVFFFTWMPIALYVFSLYFVWNRYSNIAAIIGPIAMSERNTGVMMRYMILSGDRMLLTLNEYDRWDTPAVTHVDKLDASCEDTVERTFEKLSGCTDFEMRYLYETGLSNMMPEVKHYAAFLSSELYPAAGDTGTWFTLDQLDRLMKTARLSAELSDELYRIFTITMAWKTYDTEGRRLYPIKHYRPTFRLCDLKNWKVDYNDLRWISVANNNQDRPFFHTRRFWRKITGAKM